MMNEILPEDVMIQILVCLPVISLLRFKGVCKSWNALITHQNFITKHLLHKKKKKKKKKNCEDFLVHRLERTGEDFLVSLLSYETLQVSKTKPLPPPYPGIERYNKEKYDSAVSMVSQNILPYSTLEEWMIKPLGMKKEAIPSMDFLIKEYIGQLHVRLVGSVNGLVCLHDTHWHHVLIWNPATGETKVLPGNRLDYLHLPIDYCFGSIDVGFGFDAKTNDYKVIIVATTMQEVHHPYFHTLEAIQGHIRMGCFLGMDLVIKVTVFGHLTLAMRYSYQPHCQMLPISMKNVGEPLSCLMNWLL